MNIKTINLTGAEVAVKVGGGNSEIKNNGTETIYASATSGIVAGADGVVSIPAGASVTVTDTRGTVYILGTGSVEVVGKDFVAPVFKTAASSGGGTTEDTIARNAISTHSADTDIHHSSADIAAMMCNPNLFINSDFRRPINQRGKTSYDTAGYTIDCWSISTNLALTVCDGYIKVFKSVLSGNPTFMQPIENMSGIAGETVTFSMRYRSNVQIRITGLDKNYYIPSTDGEWGNYTLTFTAPAEVDYLFAIQFTTSITQADNYIDIMWAKAEIGSYATPLTPTDPATELAKCQRYYQLRSTGDIPAADMRPSMNTITDIKQRSDSLYEYIAEI